MRKLTKEEIKSIVDFEREKEIKCGVLLKNEIDEYLEIIEEHLVLFGCYDVFYIYWQNTENFSGVNICSRLV